MQLTKRTAITLVSLCASVAAHGQVTNGDFGSGLTNWLSTGDVSAQFGGAFLTTASIIDQDDAPAAAGAFNFSGIGALGSSNGLDVFSGLAVDALDPDPGSFIYAYEGSALQQTFNVAAGDVLTFDWKLFTNDPLADYAFVVINGVKTDLGLADLATAPSSPFAFESGLSVFSQPFVSAQTVTLSVGVVDVNDFSGSTALLVDNLQVVPEPTAFSLGLLAAAAFLSQRRRRV